MAMLRINGFAIPTASLEGGETEVGSRGRAVDGTETIDRIGHIREWNGETTPQAPDVIKIVRGLLRGDGDVWPLVDNAYSAKGRTPEAGSQYTLEGPAADGYEHYDHSCFRYLGSTYLSKDTTNLFQANVRTGTDTSSDTTGFTASGVTISSSTSQAWKGSRVLKAVGSSTNYFETETVAVTQYQWYTLSWYGMGDGDDVSVTVDIVASGGSVQQETVTFRDDEWQRYEIRRQAQPGDATFKLRFTFTSSDTIYCDGFQAENNDVATAWVDGTRASDDYLELDIDTVRDFFAADYTINAWVACASTKDTTTDGGMILWLKGDSLLDRINVYVYGVDDSLRVLIGALGRGSWGASGGQVPASPSANGLTIREARMVTVVVRRNPAASEHNLQIYVDGTMVDDGDNSVFPNVDDLTHAYVGMFSPTSGHLNGWIEDLMITPFAVPDAVITAWYNAGVPMPQLPKVYVDGDFIEDDAWTVQALGEVGKSEYLAADGNNNYCRQQFTIVEAALSP